MEKQYICPDCKAELDKIDSGEYWCKECDQYFAEGFLEANDCIRQENEDDPVNHPSHYNTDKYECIEVLKEILTPEQYSGFCIGNTVKYIWRCGKKDPAKKLEDMEKALFYLDKAVESMEYTENKT